MDRLLGTLVLVSLLQPCNRCCRDIYPCYDRYYRW